MEKFSYVAVLVGCLLGSLWLEVLLRTNVLKRWRRLVRVVAIVVPIFCLWDAYAIAQGHWYFNSERTTGLFIPFDIPVDEVLFFLVIPLCSILSFEAVRSARPDWKLK